MTNADKFKSIFGLYAIELWAKPEKDFLEWMNADAELFGNSEQLEKDHVADPGNMVGDLISRQAAMRAVNGLIDRFEQILRDIRETQVDDSVCGMCEYDGAFIGQSGNWCNECPGFEKDDCFKLSDECRKRWLKEAIDGVEK